MKANDAVLLNCCITDAAALICNWCTRCCTLLPCRRVCAVQLIVRLRLPPESYSGFSYFDLVNTTVSYQQRDYTIHSAPRLKLPNAGLSTTVALSVILIGVLVAAVVWKEKNRYSTTSLVELISIVYALGFREQISCRTAGLLASCSIKK